MLPCKRVMYVPIFLMLVSPAFGQNWRQWGQNSEHSGTAGVMGQSARRILASQPVDPFVPQQIAENNGDLLAHYQAPLVNGRDVYMLFKTGEWVSCGGDTPPNPCGSGAWDHQVWDEKKMRWVKGSLVEQWTFTSDWKPVPDGGWLGGWEPVFHPVLTDYGLYVPGAGGTVLQVHKH